jgi:hypothetical protein
MLDALACSTNVDERPIKLMRKEHRPSTSFQILVPGNRRAQLNARWRHKLCGLRNAVGSGTESRVVQCVRVRRAVKTKAAYKRTQK